MNKSIYKLMPLTRREKTLSLKLNSLKSLSGTHAPSLFTIRQELPDLKIKVDACFLSNPYATDLFLEYFNKEIIKKGKLRDLLEFYPSQNKIIAKSLSKHLKISSDNIFIGNGAIEIIQAVIHNFTNKKIIINIPTFSSYYEFVKTGVQIIYNKLKKEDDYELNSEDYIKLIKKEKPDTIVLINPNNPTGKYIPYSQIIKILEAASKVDNVIIDESFIHFAFEENSFQLISYSDLIKTYPNLIIIKSMSKDFGIAGVRAGYALMSAKRVNNLLRNGFLWNSNGLSEYFFHLYSNADFAHNYEKERIKYLIKTNDFIKQLSSTPIIKVLPSKANFMLVEIPQQYSLDEFTSLLLIKYGIYVRNCSDKIGLEGNYIRIASRKKDENIYMAKSMSEIFQK